MIREHFLTTRDRDAWRRFLPANRSIFGSHGYARICETFRNYSPRLYVLESDEGSVCYPIFLRSLADLPFQADTEGKWDSGTPDFTGPLMFGDDVEMATAFPSLRDALFRGEGIVAEFAHLHPWIPVLAEGRIYNREIVWVDVTTGRDAFWLALNRSSRKGINNATGHGVRIIPASSDDHIREFCRVYYSTMDRTNALPGYYFPYEFFNAFREELPDNSRFFLAEYRDQIVAGTLCLYDDNDVYEFLGGSDSNFQHLTSFNLVIWDTICWGHEAGKKRLILGGGYKPNDGVFQFKTGFSPLRQAFYIHKQIHLHQDYALLEKRSREHNGLDGEPVSYFPAYRYQPSQSKLVPA